MNVTLSLDEDLVKRAREAARRQGRSLNDLIREHLKRVTDTAPEQDPAAGLFALMDAGKGSLEGRRFSRDDAYERRP